MDTKGNLGKVSFRNSDVTVALCPGGNEILSTTSSKTYVMGDEHPQLHTQLQRMPPLDENNHCQWNKVYYYYLLLLD